MLFAQEQIHFLRKKKRTTRLRMQAHRSLYGFMRKIRTLTLPFVFQLDLFDKIVVLVLQYASEVWGY